MKMESLKNLFKSEGAYYLFLILTAEGKQRITYLNVDRNCFYSKDAALSWYNDIKEKISTMKGDNNYNLAIEKIKGMYREITGECIEE